MRNKDIKENKSFLQNIVLKTHKEIKKRPYEHKINISLEKKCVKREKIKLVEIFI